MTASSPAAILPRPARLAVRVLGGSLRAVWVLARVAVVLGCIALAVAWKVYGFTPVAVQTGSMTPTYPVHTLLFVHDVPIDDIGVGDVISFDPPGRVPRTTHRVVKREQHNGRWYFRTKGDANPVEDDWRVPGTPEAIAKQSHLKGISYSSPTAPRTEAAIPYVGRLADLQTVPHLRAILLAIPFLVVALQLLSWIWRTPTKDEDAVEAPATAPRSTLDDIVARATDNAVSRDEVAA